MVSNYLRTNELRTSTVPDGKTCNALEVIDTLDFTLEALLTVILSIGATLLPSFKGPFDGPSIFKPVWQLY